MILKKIFYTDISNIKYEEINLTLINKDRLEKANMLKDEKKKIQSLSSYLLLRYILNEYGFDIKDYEFNYDSNNKPYIKDLALKFNISHSKNIVCCVIDTVDVGVDCEYINYIKDISRIIKYTFSDSEYQEYLKLNEKERIDYFYQKWVMKEAYFKQIGKGLTKEFKKVNLSFKTFKITDTLNNQYYISSSFSEAYLSKIEFNELNK